MAHYLALASVVFVMSFLARACGASWKPHGAEWAWAAIIAVLCANEIGQFIVYTVWGYVAMQLGHGNFFQMIGVNPANDKPESMEVYTRRIYPLSINEPAYSWFCMGIKGFLIGLPIGIVPALLLAALWPAAYAASFKFKQDTAIAEWGTGLAVGVILVAMV